MDNANRRTLDELDLFLDRTFQGRAADSTAVDPGLAECARRLYASDDAPAADPLFLRRLREDLMLTPTPAITGSSTAYQPSIVAPPRITRPRLFPPMGKSAARTLNGWRRRAWPAIELLGAAMLLLGLLAGAFSLNNGPATFTQDEVTGTAMLGGNPARTGEMPGPGPEEQPGLVWKAQVGTDGDLSPTSEFIVVDDMIYMVASGLTGFADQFSLVAMDALTGATRWQIRLDGTASAAPAVANGMVYVGITTHHVIRGEVVGTPDPITTDLGFLVAFDARTGAEEWRGETRGSQSSSPAIADGMVFVGATDGGMYAFDAESGDARWQSDVAIWNDEFLERNRREQVPYASSTPALGNDLVFITSSLGTVHALDVETGEERWVTRVPDGGLGMPVVGSDLVLVSIEQADPYLVSESIASPAALGGAVGNTAAALVALSASSGAVEWILASPVDGIAPVAASDGLVYVVESTREESQFQAIDSSTAEQRWSHSLEDGTFNAPTIVNGVAYIGIGNGQIYAFDAETGSKLWTVRIGSWAVSPVWGMDGMLYVHSGGERSIYALGGVAAGPGTPAATPPVDGDVSGIPPCNVEPRQEPEIDRSSNGTPITESAVTPEASVVAVTDLQREGWPAGMLPEDVPDGPAPTDSQVGAIMATLAELSICHRPGNEAQVAAFYSDDYFRRPSVTAGIAWNGYQGLWSPNVESELNIERMVVLEDGRIALLDRYNDIAANLIVFVEEDGQWLIDEVVQVSEHPESRG